MAVHFNLHLGSKAYRESDICYRIVAFQVHQGENASERFPCIHFSEIRSVIQVATHRNASYFDSVTRCKFLILVWMEEGEVSPVKLRSRESFDCSLKDVLF